MRLDRVLRRPGARVVFADAGGAGRPVVFTHGAGMDHTSFAAQASEVAAAGGRPILWDLRGHGRSTLATGTRFTAAAALADLVALLDAAQVDRAVLVGHSLGGNLSQEFVRRYPDRARGLIVIDATWNTGPLTAAERMALRMAGPALALVPSRRLPRLMASASAVRAEAVEEIARVFARMPAPLFRDVWRATASLVAPDPRYRTPVPLGLIRGAEDRTGNIRSAMPAWARFEGVSEHVVAGAGHVVMLDAPQHSSAALREILARMP